MVLSLLIVGSFRPVLASDITDQVFESDISNKGEHFILAFGDFNGDKLTDVFMVENEFKSLQVLLAHDKAPYLRSTVFACTFERRSIVGIFPGDFDGSGSMDLLILTKFFEDEEEFEVYIAWGSLTSIECPTTTEPLFKMHGQPLVLDYNNDFISDLFGLDSKKKRTFWIFGTNRTVAAVISMNTEGEEAPLRIPHSHGFVDLDGDMAADLLLTGQRSFELWSFNDSNFQLTRTIDLPAGNKAAVVGQSVFIDVNFDGTIDHLVPVCIDASCLNSTFYVYADDKWLIMECDLRQPDHSDKNWVFHPPVPRSHFYLDVMTPRAGDFNLDGYPDLLMTLMNSRSSSRRPEFRAVLLANEPCGDCTLGRRLVPNWDVLSDWNTTNSAMAAFYDVQENGMLDVLLAHEVEGQTRLAAYKTTLDYDANFIKVLVLTGRCYSNCSHGQIPYGTNLPGAVIAYRTVKANADQQLARGAQLSQSAYQSLQLPYVLFGLGHTPNFVEVLQVGLTHPDPTRRSREWTQIIPNSQMIIIPNLEGQPRDWLNKLFVTPSRAIVLSAAALGGFGFLLALVVTGLHCRERQLDKREKLSESYRFHFDAM